MDECDTETEENDVLYFGSLLLLVVVLPPSVVTALK